MFRIYIITILACFLLTATLAIGQNTNTANTNQVGQQSDQEKLTAEQVQQAKKFLEQLVEQPKQTTTGTSSTPQNKTVADVLDKGIDLFAGYVTSVSDMIQKIAPDVWRIMIRQQYAKAFAGLLVPFGMLFIGLLYHKLSKKWFKLGPEDKLLNFEDDDSSGRSVFVTIIPTIWCIIFGIWFANRLADAVQILINPEYYALKDLLSMILGRQTL